VADLERVAAGSGFLELRDAVLELAGLGPSDRVLDIGAGTGLLTLSAAPRVDWVHALDVSPAMCIYLERQFREVGVRNADAMLSSATRVPLPDCAVDVVISNYCFHHLRDEEKVRAVAEAMRVLRPGGRFVFTDMMFRIALLARRDRVVVTRFVRRMLARGPAGLVRLLKNAARVLAGTGEHPASVEWWRDALACAGFTDVSVTALDHEGGIAFARKHR
jgi:ubiquinone/menaquinone biosynthesis C-methylase UbiE